MTGEKFEVTFVNNSCSRCLFLNCSDTGENCKILKREIQEDPWSNIGYQFEKGWRYKGCPLLHPENLNEHKNIIEVKKKEGEVIE